MLQATFLVSGSFKKLLKQLFGRVEMNDFRPSDPKTDTVETLQPVQEEEEHTGLTGETAVISYLPRPQNLVLIRVAENSFYGNF